MIESVARFAKYLQRDVILGREPGALARKR